MELCKENQYKNITEMKSSTCIRLLLFPIAGALALLSMGGCGRDKKPSKEAVIKKADTTIVQAQERHHCNAVYHWKTTFDLNGAELEFLKDNDVQRMYVRFFDVDLDSSPMNDYVGIIPIGTTSFKSAVPDSIEIVPTVFITTKAIMSLGGDKDTPSSLAKKIFTRAKNMASYNNLGQIHEIQLDCDWTSSTQKTFYEVCKEVKSLAIKDSILVSATIRLHQLILDPPPVDRGVLMVYNTGAIRQTGTKNSILEVADVESYLGRNVASYKLPLDFAYPAFGWGVLFRGGSYQGILHHTDFSDTKYYADNSDGTFRVIKDHFLEGHFLWTSDVIRLEYPSAEVVNTVAALVSSKFEDYPHSTIIYHLDSQNLAKFKSNEIANIYSY